MPLNESPSRSKAERAREGRGATGTAPQPSQARLALFEVAPGNFGILKSDFSHGVLPQLQTTTVHGQPAAWTTGPYMLRLTNGDFTFDRVIDGHVLIWVDQGITYRLETENSASMAEAVTIAESLR